MLKDSSFLVNLHTKSDMACGRANYVVCDSGVRNSLAENANALASDGERELCNDIICASASEAGN